MRMLQQVAGFAGVVGSHAAAGRQQRMWRGHIQLSRFRGCPQGSDEEITAGTGAQLNGEFGRIFRSRQPDQRRHRSKSSPDQYILTVSDDLAVKKLSDIPHFRLEPGETSQYPGLPEVLDCGKECNRDENDGDGSESINRGYIE